jgi:GT2 family glycosyltransferase
MKNYQNSFCFVIPTLSNIQGLINLLGLLKRFYPEYPAIVINNNQNNKLERMVSGIKTSDKLFILNQPYNTGFAKACNDGAKKAKELFDPKCLVFLNDDVLFNEDWVKKCVEEMERKKWVAVTPVLIKKDNSVENCGYRILPFGKAELITDLQSNEKPDGLSATALIFKTDVFFKLKGFDERFFAYLEDVDLFLRLKKNGYKFGVCRKASVKHLGQETSSKMSAKKAYLDFKNWILLISKNWSREEIKKNFPQIIIERLRNAWGIIKSVIK